jgi:methylmalonyl-CoA mutase, C-terminal domain
VTSKGKYFFYVEMNGETNLSEEDMGKKNLRILVAKAGLDGHDRGAKIVARAFRDAGFEVIYTGLHQTPEMIVNTAVDEDVDVIGVGILSGAHNFIFPEILKLLKEKKASDILLFGGGIIPDDDVKKLRKMGVGELFPPGTSTQDIVAYINKYFKN